MSTFVYLAQKLSFQLSNKSYNRCDLFQKNAHSFSEVRIVILLLFYQQCSRPFSHAQSPSAKLTSFSIVPCDICVTIVTDSLSAMSSEMPTRFTRKSRITTQSV